MSDERQHIAIFGLGYVGCVTAACLARDGHRIIGVDINLGKVDRIRQGLAPITEPGIEGLISQAVASGGLTATGDTAEALASCSMAILTVGSPSLPDGSVDTSAISNVFHEILAHRDPRQDLLIIIRSTMLPGLLEEELQPLLENHAGCRVCYYPEFMREGTAIEDFDHPAICVVGGAAEDCQRVTELTKRRPPEVVHTDTRTAALVKYASNAFHALKVSFANEIGVLSQCLGVDGIEVMRILCMDRQLNTSAAYLKPGFAFGGSCLPKDVRALARKAQILATQTPVLDAILRSNQEHLERAVRLVAASGTKRIGLVGLAFKSDTDDLRESPNVLLAETLIGKGYDLRIFDPCVQAGGLVGKNKRFVDEHLPHLGRLLCEDVDELFEFAHLLVLGTSVPGPVDIERFSGPILDLRKALVS